MRSRLKTLVLGAVVATAALVPLFGDPRQTPVTHPLWARMLLRSLDMTDAVRTSAQASQVFSTLSWRDSLSYPAERYLQAQGAVVRDEAGQRVVTAGAAPAEVSYAVAIVQAGDYQVRARVSGPAEHARDRRGPADRRRGRGEDVHVRAGSAARLGARRVRAPRPRQLQGPVPHPARLLARAGRGRAAVREPDRAARRLAAQRGHDDARPGGHRRQGARRGERARARRGAARGRRAPTSRSSGPRSSPCGARRPWRRVTSR